MNSKYFLYNQNNSGGEFIIDREAGITEYVLIQAKSKAEADFLAQEIGIYFDGVEQGVDCGCCGSRWSRADDYDAWDRPELYGDSLKENPEGEIVVHTSEGFKFYSTNQ